MQLLRSAVWRELRSWNSQFSGWCQVHFLPFRNFILCPIFQQEQHTLEPKLTFSFHKKYIFNIFMWWEGTKQTKDLHYWKCCTSAEWYWLLFFPTDHHGGMNQRLYFQSPKGWYLKFIWRKIELEPPWHKSQNMRKKAERLTHGNY